MKKILLVMILVMSGFIAQGQNSPVQATSTKTTTIAAAPVKDAAALTKNAKDSGKTYTAKDSTMHPVWQGSKGGYFFIKKSPTTGNLYRQYLKPEQVF